MARAERLYRQGGILAYLLVIAVFLVLYLQGYIYSVDQILEPYNISIYAGVIAYVVFLSQFLLSARVRWIERAIGQDRLLQIHGFLGMALLGVVVLHAVIKYIYIGISVQSALGVAAVVLYALLAPAALLILQGRGAKKATSPPYETVKKGHNLFFIAAVLVVIHVQLASTTYSVALRTATLGWAVITLGAYVYHKFIRPRTLKRFTVADVEEREGNLVAVTLKPRTGTQAPARKPGQFFYYRFYSAAVGPEEHPFTAAGAPNEPIQIIARKVGDFTSALAGVSPGDQVTAEGPYGRFIPPEDPTTPVYLFAGGIGVTPMASMLRDRQTRSDRDMTLVWSVRNLTEAQAVPEIELTDDGVSKWIFVTGEPREQGSEEAPSTAGKTSATEAAERPQPTGPAPDANVIDGFVTKDHLERIVPAEHRATGRFYICGPPPFMNAVEAGLRSLGIRRGKIRTERFSWK